MDLGLKKTVQKTDYKPRWYASAAVSIFSCAKSPLLTKTTCGVSEMELHEETPLGSALTEVSGKLHWPTLRKLVGEKATEENLTPRVCENFIRLNLPQILADANETHAQIVSQRLGAEHVFAAEEIARKKKGSSDPL